MSGIIVVGSGIAGLCAAYSALRSGASDVTVISAFPLGSTHLASWGVIRTKGVDGKDLYSSVVDCSEGLSNKSMVRKLVESLPETIDFVKQFTDIVPAAKTGYKMIGGGALFSKILSRAIRDMGGKFVKAQLTEIISEGQIVRGVMVSFGQKPIFVSADAVILASGGGSSLFVSSDNMVTQMGEGYALALRSGAKVQDMEFQIYHPMAQKINNSVSRRYSMLEMFKLENCLITDCSGNRLYDIERLINSHKSHSKLLQMSRKIYDHKSVFVKCDSGRRIEVKPVVHSFSGGVTTDDKAMTDVKGLFACGEVVGGLNGAGRIAGTAFSEAIIFGRIAGKNAFEYSLGVDSKNNDYYTSNESYTFKWSDYAPDEISFIVEQSLFMKRSYLSLSKALKKLQEVRADLERRDFRRDLKNSREYNRVLTAESIVLASLNRRESRGTFYRLDYPEQDGDYAKNLYIKMNSGRLEIV